MANSWATRSLDSRVRLATATICTSSCFAKPGICKALVLPPAPIRPTRIFFSDMMRHLSVDGACQSTAGLVASGMWSAMEVMVLQRAPLHSMHKSRATDHSFGSQHSLGLTELNGDLEPSESRSKAWFSSPSDAAAANTGQKRETTVNREQIRPHR